MKKQLSLALSVLLLTSSLSLHGASTGYVDSVKKAVTKTMTYAKIHKTRVAVAVAAAAIAAGAVVVAYKKSSWVREFLGVEDKKAAQPTRLLYTK